MVNHQRKSRWKWSLQKGYLPLPKSVTPTRIIENGELFDFELSVEDIATIDTSTVPHA
jgi:diketogulonate reductase-like aldo/keto reductase